MHQMPKLVLRGCRSKLTLWAREVRQSLGRELRAMQVSHKDAAFLATKDEDYQHLAFGKEPSTRL